MLGRKEWTRGTVVNSQGRSHDVKTPAGNVVKRNRVHLRQVPHTVHDHVSTQETADSPSAAISVPEPQEPGVDATIQPVPASLPKKTSSPRKTRSGRLVKPNQLKDFIYA